MANPSTEENCHSRNCKEVPHQLNEWFGYYNVHVVNQQWLLIDNVCTVLVNPLWFSELKSIVFLSVNKSITVIDTHFLHVKIGKEGFLKPLINHE